MPPRILLIAGTELCTYLQENIRTLDLDAEITFQEYKTMESLPALYREKAPGYDGVCVTGFFAQEVILRTRTDHLPIRSIAAKSVEYYKEFFRLLNADRQMDFSRVVLDSDLWRQPAQEGGVLAHFREQGLERRRMELVKSLSLEQIIAADGIVFARAQQLYTAGKIDLLICRFSSVLPLLQEAGIPHSFVYPGVENIENTLNLLCNDIKLQKKSSALPAVIFIASPSLPQNGAFEISEDSVEMQKGLLEFTHQQELDLMIQKAVGGYEAFTTQHAVQSITQDFTTCQLQRYLYSRTGMQIYVGYGIGRTLLQARANALQACQLAAAAGKSYVVDENGGVIGPLDSNATLRVEGGARPSVLAAAQSSGLSVSTIQRILSVTELLGTRELTSQQLAQAMQMTVANANRFLNALKKGGCAEIVSEKRPLTKGRPSKVYRIFID